MITHALTIITNELIKNLAAYGVSSASQVELGNLSEGFKTGAGSVGVNRDVLNLSVVNIKEESTLKNIPAYIRNDVTLKASYENPPVFLNFLVLLVATHANYADALLMLSRAIRFFQSKNVFTQDSVEPASITTNAPINALDRLVTFKLILELYSPTMEEVNHLWGTLGGKQYPFVLYKLRMLELKFKTEPNEQPLIVEIVTNIRQMPG